MKENSIAEKNKGVTVRVNTIDVVFESNKATGTEIKATAIEQGVEIQQDFNLFEKMGNSGKFKPVKDDGTVTLHPNQEFRAVAPDDNSQK